MAGDQQRGRAGLSRRAALALLGGFAAGMRPIASADAGTPAAAMTPRRFRIRALTAGVPLRSLTELATVDAVLDFLDTARAAFASAAYDVQTTRIAITPLLLDAPPALRASALPALAALDRRVHERGSSLSIGPVFAHAAPDPSLATWAAELIRATQATFFSVAVSSPARGVHETAVTMTGSIISALATAIADGTANFRFGAAASIPAGTPFFPAGFHDGEASLAVGLESANLVADAFAGAPDASAATDRLRSSLNRELRPVELLARQLAAQSGRRYIGIDASPAPGLDSSIGAALESLTGRSIGDPTTLRACAAVTAALRSLDVATCGYSGLMLPVLEDPVLAARAAEGRVGLSRLLLYSSVCGTGLDVVPVPGESDAAALAAVVGDVAALAARLSKPLSVRLFPVPGKRAGDTVALPNPLLCASRVLALDS